MQKLYLQLSLSGDIEPTIEGLSVPPFSGIAGHLFVRGAFSVPGGIAYLFGRIYSPRTEQEIRGWLAEFDATSPGAWVDRCDGDFTVTVHNQASGKAWVMADRNGQHRAYFGVEDGLLRVSSSLVELATRMKTPRLSQEGVFHLLTLRYSLDPTTLLQGVQATAPGVLFEVEPNGILERRYYSPVKLNSDYFPTMEACVTGLDDAFRATFAKRYDPSRDCTVLLSGGIDSVAMLRYLSELAPGKIEAFTFGIRGDEEGDEVRSAKMVAKHFGVRHRLHWFEPREVARYLGDSISQADGPHYGAAMWFSMRPAVLGESETSDVYSGQDTRLHTPSFDVPKSLGVRLSAKGNSLLNSGWRAVLAAARMWPLRGKRTLAYWRQASDPQASVQNYIVKNILNVSAKCTNSGVEAIIGSLPNLSTTAGVQEIFKAVIQFEYRTQFTDDMNTFCAAIGGPGRGIHFPFYDHEFVAACNRIPYNIGAQHIFTTHSWSWIPFTQKAVLRKLLLKSVPPELVYRRKATLPSIHLAFNAGLCDLVGRMHAQWGGALVDALDVQNGANVRQIIAAAREVSVPYRCPEEHDLAWDAYVVAYLAVLNQLLSGNAAVLEQLVELAAEIAGNDAPQGCAS